MVIPLTRRAALVSGLFLIGCAASSHRVEPAKLGTVASSEAMMARLSQPGPIAFERIVGADWVVDRGGLINLDHPKAVEAGLESGEEPMQVYAYALRHPEHGLFFVDSGVEQKLRNIDNNPRIPWLLASAANLESFKVVTDTRSWLAKNGGKVDGVFITHLHFDHVLGLPDMPAGTALYTGPGEAGLTNFQNMFVQGVIDDYLAGHGPLNEWQFDGDAGGRFEGVIDVFGDGSLWALYVPGHTPGSTAYLARTTGGPVLMVGDACHTAWGWHNGVEPGAFSNDIERSVGSLKNLRELVEAAPGIEVHLGHQSLTP